MEVEKFSECVRETSTDRYIEMRPENHQKNSYRKKEKWEEGEQTKLIGGM
jgi:hypothetical protein